VAAVVRFPPVRLVSSLLIGLANVIIGRDKDDEASPNAGVTESELRAMADVAHAEDVIETAERAFIHSIIDFGDTVVREVMVPRPDMVTLEADATVTEALEASLAAGYSRLPVYRHNVDDVIGIAYTKDLMRIERAGRGAEKVEGHARAAHYVPETKLVAGLLREMQDRKFHQSIVVDEYGGTAGLVTLEDLIEELVGEIVDEFDVEEPTVERRADGSVVVAGRMPISEADELLDAELPEGAWDTVGGLVLDLAGRVPHQGESVELDGFRLVAERVQGRRIGRVRIERRPVLEAPSAED
jgi:CBS domain containing-hemolysin-like protein